MTNSNQAYAATDYRAGNAGYEIVHAGMVTGNIQRRVTFDTDAYEVINDEDTLGESAQHKQVLSDHDAYEVIYEEENLGSGEKTAQLTDMKDRRYVNMDGGNYKEVDESKMTDT